MFQNIKSLIIIALVSSYLMACAIQKQSNINQNTIKMGMSKQQVMRMFGEPYKQDMYFNEETRSSEITLYYKEKIIKSALASGYTEMISRLHFNNNKLVSLEQDDQWIKYDDSNMAPAQNKYRY